MRPQISSFFKHFSKDVTSINRLLVTSYIYINEIKVNNNLFIKKYIIEESEGREYQSFVSFVKLLSKLDLEYNIENLIELFEFVISPAEKEVNGAVYTPQYVREFIKQNFQIIAVISLPKDAFAHFGADFQGVSMVIGWENDDYTGKERDIPEKCVCADIHGIYELCMD